MFNLGLHISQLVPLPNLWEMEAGMVTALIITLINVLILLANVTVLHAVLKAYSEMTKTKLLRKMTEE